jgi:hypothetical protein
MRILHGIVAILFVCHALVMSVTKVIGRIAQLR